jgi:hypothetical protein
MAKVSELWEEVERSLAEKTLAGSKMAVLEAHKVLELVLKTEGYPGKVERQLNLAGYSLSEKDPIAEAIKKQKEILASFEYQISDFEAEEIVSQYKKVIDEVLKRGEFTGTDKLKAFGRYYFSPKSLVFWRNLGIVAVVLVLIKFLSKTEAGLGLVTWIVNAVDFIISWQFLVILIVVAIAISAIVYFYANRPKVKIKD